MSYTLFFGNSKPSPQTATANVASTGIAGIAPSATATGAVVVSAGAATTTLTSANSSIAPSSPARPVPGVGVVSVTGIDPVISSPGFASAGVALLVASGVAVPGNPTGAAVVIPGDAVVAASGVDPSASQTGGLVAVPGSASTTVVLSSPAITGSGVGTADASFAAVVSVGAFTINIGVPTTGGTVVSTISFSPRVVSSLVLG